MSNGPVPVTRTVTIEFKGREISASYSIASGVVTVHSAHGKESTQIVGSSAKSSAKILLLELAKK
jgi:hypothetical protein